MRLLAIDESSTATGLAYFEGDRCSWTKRLAPAADWPWRRRMRWIADALRAELEERGLTWTSGSPPDVVAIEDAVVARKNPMMGVAVGECRGYLKAHLDSLLGLEVRIMDITPAQVRAVVGISAFAARERSKDRYRLVATQLLGISADRSEDELDAACIGLAALAALRAQRWRAMAEGGLDRRGGSGVG